MVQIGAEGASVPNRSRAWFRARYPVTASAEGGDDEVLGARGERNDPNTQVFGASTRLTNPFAKRRHRSILIEPGVKSDDWTDPVDG